MLEVRILSHFAVFSDLSNIPELLMFVIFFIGVESILIKGFLIITSFVDISEGRTIFCSLKFKLVNLVKFFNGVRLETALLYKFI